LSPSNPATASASPATAREVGVSSPPAPSVGRLRLPSMLSPLRRWAEATRTAGHQCRRCRARFGGRERPVSSH
jgi:hypothetical protein